MFTKIKNSASRFKSHLTQIGDEQPLSKAALVVLIFLDVFFLVSVFDGLSKHTRQLASPYEYVSYQCRDIVINKSWDKTKRLDNLNEVISSRNNYLLLTDKVERNQHPLCLPFSRLIDKIEQDKELSRLFENRRNFQRESRELENRIRDRKGGYDTTLLESIAGQDKTEHAEVSAIKQDFQRMNSSLNTLRGQLDALDVNLDQADSIKTLWQNIQSISEENREQLKAEIRTLSFWYPVKQLGMQLIFLLPLFAIIYAWNSASIRKSWQLQTLVSSHLLVVVSIPILFKFISAIYDIIPKKLMKVVIELLESLNLIAIWYYLMMGLSVIGALLVIYIFQKKLFSHEKLLQKRISKGLCQKCGVTLPHNSPACPACGFMQYKPCRHCGKLMYVYAKFCNECGKPPV